MSIPGNLLQPDSKILIGNDAAWHLAFHKEEGGKIASGDPVLELGRADYYAEIQATLPSGLEGGVYTFTIEGLTDAHYAAINQGKEGAPTAVRLYLYWRDTNSTGLGYLKNLAGLTDTFGTVKAKDLSACLVAELRISEVTRKAGARRYETTIKAKERVFAILESERLAAKLDPGELVSTAESLVSSHGITTTTYKLRPAKGVDSGEHKGKADDSPNKGEKLIDVLKNLGSRMEQRANKHGRGMYLIREGTLHIGPREIDTEIETATELDLSAGLIQSEKLAPLETDPHFDLLKARESNKNATIPVRNQFKLTMKGRQDMKPGRVVKFNPAKEDEEKLEKGGGFVGAMIDAFTPSNILPKLGETFDASSIRLYIASVEHKQGRTSGWVTTVTGVVIHDGEDAWDEHSDHRSSDDKEKQQKEAASAELRSAKAIAQLAANLLERQKHPEAGEIRGVTTKGKDEPPGQTVRVWTGLDRADGRRNQVRRRPVRKKDPAEATGVTYLTPFAWGKFGLVLPQYPGTRVLVGYRGGAIDDPVALGALWESGTGPESEPGDWWLILPTGIDEAKRADLTDDQSASPNGKASNDLIDAKGQRAIEVTKLTIRVGEDKVKDAGTRPTHGEDKIGVTIEHKGAMVTIDDDGTITLKAAKNIVLDASSGDIELKAKNVKVSVSGSMDVGGD